MIDLSQLDRAFFDNTPDGAMFATPEGVVLEMNRAMQEMLVYDQIEVAGGRLSRADIVVPDGPNLDTLLSGSRA